MAGHSKWANIKHKKAAEDKKRAKVFGRSIREITVAARDGGPDPGSNPKLRLALAKAQAVNLPRPSLERAIERGSGNAEMDTVTEVRYEGYGPGGVQVMVEAETDNKNRTVAAVRSVFTKFRCDLGTDNCVAYNFRNKGRCVIEHRADGMDDALELAMTVGADDCDEDGEALLLWCEGTRLAELHRNLEEEKATILDVALLWEPVDRVSVDGEVADKAQKFIDALENLDDVTVVWDNRQIA